MVGEKFTKMMKVGVKQLSPIFAATSIVRPSTTIALEPLTHEFKNSLESAKPFDQIPGFKSLPFLGTTWVFMPLIGKYSLQDALDYDVAKYEKFGPIVRDKFDKLEVVNLFDPDDIEWVFRNEDKYPTRFDFSSIKAYRALRSEWFKNVGAVALEGKEWYDLRFRLQKNMLKISAIERFVAPMEEVTKDLVQHIIQIRDHNNEVPNTLEQLMKWALESVGFLGLNIRLGCLREFPSEESKKMVESAHITFALIKELEAFSGNIQWWKWFSTPTWRKFVRALDFFTETALKYINQSVEDVKEKLISGNEEHLMMIQAMLADKDLRMGEVITMLMDMLLAGINTTSHSVQFLLYSLAKTPEKQEKLYQEITNFLPNPSDRLTPEILRKMTYVKYCIKESQRLYPVARGILRTLEKDVALSGYKVPSGTTIMGALYVIQQQEKYFKNAKEFIPERWMMDAKDKPHPFSVLPFGFGIRSCIGRRLAELEMQCLAIEVIRRFKVEYHHEDFKFSSGLVIAADRPLSFTFLDRNTQKSTA